MAKSKLRWDIAVGAAVLGALVGGLFELPPLDGWLEALSARTWVGLPWLLLAVLWAVIGYLVYRQHRRRAADQVS